MRARLLAVAGRILAEEGPDALSNRRLAAEADTTTRAIYTLFDNKAGLFRALCHESARIVSEELAVVAEHDDPLEELMALALAYRRAAITNPHLYRLQFEGGLAGLRPDADDRRAALANFGRVLAAVTRCVQAGIFPGRSPMTITLQTWATNHGLASLEIHGHLAPPQRAEARWRDHIGAMLAGYRVPPSGVDGNQSGPASRAVGRPTD